MVIVIDWLLVPPVTLKFNAPGLVLNAGGALTFRVTLTVCGLPAEGVISTLAVYCPGGRPVAFTLKESGDEAPELSLPLPGETLNHGREGVPTVHVNVPPPVLLTLMLCGAGLLPPAVVVKVRFVALNCIAGGAIVIVMLIVDGLPATALPVSGSIAVTVTLVV